MKRENCWAVFKLTLFMNCLMTSGFETQEQYEDPNVERTTKTMSMTGRLSEHTEMSTDHLAVRPIKQDYSNLTYIFEDRNLLLPFCFLLRCEISEEIFQTSSLQIWNCMNKNCRAGIIAPSVVCTIFALVTTFGNLTVLAVHFFNKKLINPQAIYKISLAFSDVFVGLFIFPTFISSAMKSVTSPVDSNFLTFVGYYKFFGDVKITNSVRNPYSRFLETLTETKNEDLSYYNAVGVFGLTSVSVSSCTLVAAAIDRFQAVYRPLAYNGSRSISMAKKISVTIWIGMIIFSTFPLYVNGYGYGLVYPMLIIPTGLNAPIIYAVALFVPVLLGWIVTISTFVVYKKTADKRKRLMANRFRSREIRKQIKLLFTLGLMVGVFTLCLVPTIAVTLLQFLPNFRDLRGFYNSARVVVGIVFASNSLWNFFIYSARNKDFRDTAKQLYSQLFSSLKCCKKS